MEGGVAPVVTQFKDLVLGVARDNLQQQLATGSDSDSDPELEAKMTITVEWSSSEPRLRPLVIVNWAWFSLILCGGQNT